MVKGLDLNCGYNNGMEIMEKQNRGFVDVDDEVESKGLSLLLWSGHPNEEDDDNFRKLHVNNENINDGEENEEIVGWPPINSLRKELIHRHHQGGWMANHRAAPDHRDNNIPVMRSSMYVKVKMEGVPIGRKIDLRLFNSYQALTQTLIDMFAKYTRDESSDGDYTILYQDKEGDWMLAGDVPWETFVESVRRMEILRNIND
ncbi:hypothetical protein DH2020_047930 [Rehmannia glutinosa]|uniref:Auxin-responsive protein n=1 Tax=Rehmannia glutinosa TaxID=99300 RepID=A0ABR0U765_REHGL